MGSGEEGRALEVPVARIRNFHDLGPSDEVDVYLGGGGSWRNLGPSASARARAEEVREGEGEINQESECETVPQQNNPWIADVDSCIRNDPANLMEVNCANQDQDWENTSQDRFGRCRHGDASHRGAVLPARGNRKI